MFLRISPTAGVKALSLVLSMSLAPVPVLAAPDVATQVSRQLSAQGYRQIEVQRTLLGKVVVTARGNGHLREIVIDPRNGALLRDLVRPEGGGQNTVGIARLGDRQDDDKDDDGKGGDGKGGDGKGGDDRDDGDNSGSDDDGDDNSGSGGSGDDDSGSGGDDDSSGGGGGDDDSGGDDRDDD